MKIGLYFGSFNPVHVAHLIIANHILNETDIEKIWFVVSPQNPFKVESNLLNEYHRLHLVRLATEEDNRIKASDIEFGLPKPSYTSSTLAYLAEKNPEHQFCIIMGSDSFQNLHKWKNYEVIVKNYPVYVYLRPGFEVENHVAADLTILDAPLLQLSATQIRKYIKEGKSVRYMLPEKVLEEIEKGGYYKK
ncbi:MAG: nicotinate-nucleotide adenylyltransferase [Chitinophagaceae bacterium]|jgi:nicotinate-nucleotide adenylyltransferase|nr:nicotinate-nucleotide adenylyltransferase [Chitinophagaceae bacterium]MBK7678111.1 nicotinate-nucleotide adenylyltransferase [Chitinophagaceae bacterium]MBK8301427.1 nicotinate-nucleotide adenylyltransferase [Chitinophagaceae bacterium]MBK9466055.1 nicotinate-nucleotide adenylyltransferase [Chitinophagaceae bacterium]MBK9661372.1 nicotinate-nucleotide adenylyltransferase [Chitinophagaceae bacterium]